MCLPNRPPACPPAYLPTSLSVLSVYLSLRPCIILSLCLSDLLSHCLHIYYPQVIFKNIFWLLNYLYYFGHLKRLLENIAFLCNQTFKICKRKYKNLISWGGGDNYWTRGSFLYDSVCPSVHSSIHPSLCSQCKISGMAH